VDFTPEDEFRRWLDRLPEQLRRAALMRLEGYSNAEIAEKHNRSTATVERWFYIIRRRGRDEGTS
jgi:DNA-directed RNA polymerase specialized sigma24 family protein